ncbi:MAG: ABC transporter permease [Actinomycetota bacterium]
MSDYWPYIVGGVTEGSIFALVAAGLVLTFRTTGTFNLAFGAQAYVSAVVFYDLRKEAELPVWVAFVVAVLVVAPLLALVLDRLVFRFLTRAPVVTRIGVALGLAVALPAVVALYTAGEQKFGPPSLGPSPPHFYSVGSLSIDSDQVIAMVATVVVVVLIGLVLRYTALGLQMRAVVESHRLVELAGVDANRANLAAWVLSSVVAGLAGVLLAPLNLGSLDARRYTILVVGAIAAAVFARLRSLPLAIVGGLLLGLCQSMIVKFLEPESILAQGLRPAFPFAAIVLLLLFLPGLRDRPEAVDPLAGVDPPARVTAISVGGNTGRAQVAIAFACGIVASAAAIMLLSDFWLGKTAQAVILATIFLSFVVLTGLAGHLSLCQAAFAGIGAFTAAQLAAEQGMSVIGGAVVGAMVAAAAGAVVALPSLRLSGLFLALATLAFGLMLDNVIFPQPWASGSGTRGLDVPRPLIGTIDFTSNASFLVLSGVAFALVAMLVWLLRRGTTGAFLGALRGSPVAAVSIGIDERSARVLAFTIAAGIAGFGGALLAAQQGSAAPVNFITDLSLYWTVVALAVGVATIRSAFAAGLLIVFVPELLNELPERWIVLQFVLFGLGVLVLARHPEGAFEFVVTKFHRRRLAA